jgi:NADH-quinone oxidoreductase subunit N
MWTPDVYQGAPASITGYMSAGVKAAAFVSLARLLFAVFGSASEGLYFLLWALAAITMVVGNILALVQTNIKRMLAYSSIAHAGYLLVALAAGSAGGTSAMLFYLLVYALSNLGAFAAVTAMSGHEEAEELSSWAGIGYRRPALGIGMAIFMLSLAGIPPTAGFFGKFYMFKEAVDRGLINLAVIGMLSSAIGVYYYLRVIVTMYMTEGVAGAKSQRNDIALSVGLVIVTTGIMILGVAPGRLLEIAQRSVAGLFGS